MEEEDREMEGNIKMTEDDIVCVLTPPVLLQVPYSISRFMTSIAQQQSQI